MQCNVQIASNQIECKTKEKSWTKKYNLHLYNLNTKPIPHKHKWILRNEEREEKWTWNDITLLITFTLFCAINAFDVSVDSFVHSFMLWVIHFYYFITMRDANKHILRISHWIRAGMGNSPIVTRHCPIDQKYVSDSLSIMNWSQWNYACPLWIRSDQTRASFLSSNISVFSINPWLLFLKMTLRDWKTPHPWDREADEAIVRGIEEDIIIQQQCQCIVNSKFWMSSSLSLCRHWCHKLRRRWGITRRNST